MTDEHAMLIGSLVAVATIVGSAVWAVGTIKSTTASLREAINGLKDRVYDLQTAVTKLLDKVEQLSARVSFLEGAHRGFPREDEDG